MAKKPYRDGVTLFQIIQDGWSRDLPSWQTFIEARMMGFKEIRHQTIERVWRVMEYEFKKAMPVGKKR